MGSRKIEPIAKKTLLAQREDKREEALQRSAPDRSVPQPASPAGQAALLARLATNQPARATLLARRLQRAYGNRYVGGLVNLARAPEEEPDESVQRAATNEEEEAAQRASAESEDEKPVQRAAFGGAFEADQEVEEGIQRARGGGQALDGEVRRRMEGAMGADFGGVRVHTGAQADGLNRALSARAFTTGSDIFFRDGEYRPGSAAGRELLAHELTHVVQQGGGVRAKLTVGAADDEYEREADRVARAVVQREEHNAEVRPQDENEKVLQTKRYSSNHLRRKRATHSVDRRMSEIYTQHGLYLKQKAIELGIEPSVAAAVMYVESGGSGFQDGQMIIRFENHKFFKYWGAHNQEAFAQHFRMNTKKGWQGHEFRASVDVNFESFHGNQAKEWDVFRFARNLDEEAATKSISMGAAQMMGDNYAMLGYKSAVEMFEQYSGDLRSQLDGMFTFIRKNKKCMQGLKTGDFALFASGYNGPGQVQSYADRIKEAANAYAKVADSARDTGSEVTPTQSPPSASTGDASKDKRHAAESNSAAFFHEAMISIWNDVSSFWDKLTGIARGDKVTSATEHATSTSTREPTSPDRVAGTTREGGGSIFYHNQLANEYRQGKIQGSNMCNVTTLAMQLELLAGSPEKAKTAAIELLKNKAGLDEKALLHKSLPDLIMMRFDSIGDAGWAQLEGRPPLYKGWYAAVKKSGRPWHQQSLALNYVALEFSNIVGKAEHTEAVKEASKKQPWTEKTILSPTYYKSVLKPALEHGAAIMLSTLLTGGHIVLLVDIVEDGIIINDPYGLILSKKSEYLINGALKKWMQRKILNNSDIIVRRLKYNQELLGKLQKPESLGDTLPQNMGERNFFSWEEVEKYAIGKWNNVLYGAAKQS